MTEKAMTVVRFTPSIDRAREWSLVLSSQGIVHRLEPGERGYFLVVDDEAFGPARNAIRLYQIENKQSLVRNPFVERFHRTYSGLFVALVMVAVHIRLPLGQHREMIVAHYGSSASHVLHGEWYRLVTALFLHGSDTHLAGNIAGLILFGTSVASLTGPGVGWFMILVSGVAGNGINAYFFKSNHLSIGSSTAIFGAIGILAAYRCTRILSEKGPHGTALMPIGAGIALLGLLGSSAHSDTTAHLFGFIAGLGCGAIYGRWIRNFPTESIQLLFMILTTVILMAAWALNRF